MPFDLPIVLSAPAESLLYSGQYNPLLVTLSMVIAIFAAYASLLISQQVMNMTDRGRRHLWVAIGGLCMGAGIWAMHFVGMLAFSLPCSTSYEPLGTLFSMVPGVLASILAMWLISRHELTNRQLLAGGTLFGAGVGSMHYAGMAAYRLEGLILYDLKLFLLSLIVAVTLAVLAIWIRHKLQHQSVARSKLAIPLAASVMGLAASGMHYTAMAAAYFVVGEGSTSTTTFSSAFLATVVLVATSGIIVITLVAVFMGHPKIHSLKGIHRWMYPAIAVWLGLAWMSANYYADYQAERHYREALEQANRKASEISNHINNALHTFGDIPHLLSQDKRVIEALEIFGPDAVTYPASREQRRTRWESDPLLAELNNYLAQASDSLGIGNIYVINAAGDCVSSSNATTDVSFVGAAFNFRDYYLMAKSGVPGSQYAMGKVSNVPGIYKSFPVKDADGRFIGAVVVKRLLSNLSQWTKSSEALLTDKYGVIVNTNEPRLLFHSMPGSQVMKLTQEARINTYRREEIPPLDIKPWRDGKFEHVFQISGLDTPLVLARHAIKEWGLSASVPQRLDELVRLEKRLPWTFLIISMAGILSILSFIVLMLYLRANQEARHIAESANAAKSTFLAAMSHELRTPLNAILGLSHIMGDDSAFPEEYRDNLEIIHASGKHLLTLINDILDLAKIEAGRFELSPEPTHLPAIFKNIEDLFRLQARDKGLRFESKLESNLPEMVNIDKKRLRQILINLLNNAVKFTKHGQVSLHTRIEDNTLVIEVADSGIGISPKHIKHIFTPFFQEGSQHYKSQGTGLGLAITKSLVERMGGTIDVVSTLGTGTQFTVRLALEILQQDISNNTVSSTKIRGYQRNDGHKELLRILIVDDLLINRLVLKRMLENHGFEVDETDSGEACLEYLKKLLPDLIFMDIVMPGIDGLETTRRIKAMDIDKDIPIIACSANAYEEDKDNARNAGCIDYVDKPIHVEYLHKVLEKHLPIRWLMEADDKTPAPPPDAQ